MAVGGDSGQLDPSRPGWDFTEAELRAWAHEAADVLTTILVDGTAGAAVRRPPAELIDTWQHQPWDDAGTDVAALLSEVSATILPFPFGNAHPRFSAWVNSPPHPVGALAAGLAAALNPSVAGGNQAAVHVEHEVVRWFCEELGWAAPAGGQFVSGASAASLTALTAARHRALGRVGYDDRARGLAGCGHRLTVYSGAESHSCHAKAAEALGIGSANIVHLPGDADFRVRADELDRRLTADREQGALPVAVIASAGTVNTGAVDPIGEIADICRRHDVWLHVDGAYGGPAVLFLPEWRTELAGLSRADSIAIDPHKWLYVPVDAGLVLFRDRDAARETFSLVPDYLRTGGDPAEPVWFSEYGLEQTRPFRALKVWMVLKSVGREGFRRLVARDVAVAAALRDAVDAAGDFELLGAGLSIVCFRYRPRDVADEALDDLNTALLHRLRDRGNVYLAGTRVEGRFGLRACIVNPRTTTWDVAALIDEIRTAAAR
jgi:glutamate/tyrosine decarboxylase-like PLP-dependent enzyme